MKSIGLFAAASLALATGCTGTLVEPGHRGLLFDPNAGLQHEVLNSGYHHLEWFCFLKQACRRVDDFDVTYSTHKETVHTTSSEGLALDLHLAIIYRPIISELYQLDTETGPNYYDEVVAPEFRSAARGVFAHHSYTELQTKNEKIEDEVEADVRRRTSGKHIEIASVTLEGIDAAPEIAAGARARLVSEQQKAQLETDSLRKQVEIQQLAEQARIKAELELKQKQNERALATEQAAIDKEKAEADAVVRVTKAQAEAKERMLLAKAQTEENRAQSQTLTPLAVMMHAYDALGSLGGTGTTVYLGDFSQSPRFLFPGGAASLAGAFGGWGGTAPHVTPPATARPTPPAGAPTSALPGSGTSAGG